jgi:hypothetical protein
MDSGHVPHWNAVTLVGIHDIFRLDGDALVAGGNRTCDLPRTSAINRIARTFEPSTTGEKMKLLGTTALACGILLLSGCATQQPYLATHARTSQLAEIHELHVISVIDQDKLDAQHNTLYVNTVPIGAVAPAAIIGGALGGALVAAEADHEARVFADEHVAPLLTTLRGYDGRAAIRRTLKQGIDAMPVRMADWKTIDAKTADADLLPANAPAGSAWLVLHTRYTMTPDFSGLQVVTTARLYLYNPAILWRDTPVYKNDFTYQSTLLHMPEKTDAVRKRMTDEENARYAKLGMSQQIAKANASDPYDPVNARLREKIHDEQWQHEAKLKQIASPFWSPDERATWFVKQWQADDAASLKQFIAEGGTQTARMLALDLDQQQPQLANDAKRDWTTVYRDAQRTIQDAPDGSVYSVADGDVTHGAGTAMTTTYYSMPVAH